MLTDADLQATSSLVSNLINGNSNLILGELDRMQQKTNSRFDDIKQDLQEILAQLEKNRIVVNIKAGDKNGTDQRRFTGYRGFTRCKT